MVQGIEGASSGDRGKDERLLDWHQATRERRRAVVSALVGAPEKGSRLFRAWLRERGRECVELPQTSEAEVVSAFVGHLEERARIGERAVLMAASLLGERAERLDARLCRLGGAELSALFEALADRWPPGVRPLGECLLAVRSGGVRSARPRRDAKLVGAASKLATARLPGLLIRAPDDQLERASQTLLAIAEEAPEIPAAVVVCRQTFDEKVLQPPELRWKAVLGEGRVLLSPAARLGSSRAGSGARDRLEDLRARASALLEQAERGEASFDDARSAAERLLFARLEAEAETAGLFEQNGKLAVDFGPGPAEVDLLCRSLALAVEIDGYYHFRDREGFRRDRRKDVLLQKEGLFVLRCLANDVVARIDEVFLQVVDCVRFCRDGRPRR